MTRWARVRAYLRRLTSKRKKGLASRLLREFVYLDDVSVCSLLASLKGGIAAEITESQTVSFNRDTTSALGVGVGGTGGRLSTALQSGHAQSSQVLRKANIQANFKELYETAGIYLTLRRSDEASTPTITSVRELEQEMDQLAADRWLFDPSTLKRGDLLEVDVELDADPIFRVASVIAAIRGIMEDNEQLFGTTITTQLPQMRSMARVLESLLVGLVPVRGRLVDYDSVRIGNKDVLVHRSLCKNMAVDARAKTYPTFVVGVAQSDLFWKDIRRILFSGGKYTVFCRLAAGRDQREVEAGEGSRCLG